MGKAIDRFRPTNAYYGLVASFATRKPHEEEIDDTAMYPP
jgi:hypothetical protein